MIRVVTTVQVDTTKLPAPVVHALSEIQGLSVSGIRQDHVLCLSLDEGATLTKVLEEVRLHVGPYEDTNDQL